MWWSRQRRLAVALTNSDGVEVVDDDSDEPLLSVSGSDPVHLCGIGLFL